MKMKKTISSLRDTFIIEITELLMFGIVKVLLHIYNHICSKRLNEIVQQNVLDGL